ncbi:serine/threonine protein kinase [Nonomuraea maritima]|uniref:serine/threonine protein kinase n=1 Tax=Nonomuraea maritima TaxID=683260 RepID=UPI00371730C8
MPSYAPLQPGDPRQLGGLALLGRLGEGGQGVVYLAEDSSGARVAVKWLRPDLSGDRVSAERFLREVQVARQVAPFCTAAVLGTGVEDNRPYIVSEFIEGPSMSVVVRDEGPRTGSALHRLAIGTATALAAIHQAGIVHRDFKPANVILGGDGARVIDFGIARALDANATISGAIVGTPAYMAPEQIMGRPAGPATDMFAWAGTMVFAATGHGPFGGDTMPAVLNRVLNEQPDLGPLDGVLRDVVAACLAKDPALRPTAEQVIKRLLQGSASGSGMLAEAASFASATAPTPRRRRGPLSAGLAVAAALVVVAGVFVATRTGPTSGAGPTAAASATSVRPSAQRAVPSSGTRATLPGGALHLYENPADAITLTSYEIYDEDTKDWVDYARDSLDGAFRRYGDNFETTVSPDGRYLAARSKSYSSDDFDFVVLTDRRTGDRTTVKTVKKPLSASIQRWSRDSSTILLNVERKDGDGKWVNPGYVLVDVAARKATTVNVSDTAVRANTFGFDDRDEGAVNFFGDEDHRRLRFFGTDGQAKRSTADIGTLPSGAQDLFSPSGRMFVSDCPNGGDGTHCLWDTATGQRLREFISDCDEVLGFYDEDHLYCWEEDNAAADEIHVVDYNGRFVRKLLEKTDDLDVLPIFTRHRAGGS